MLRQAGFRRVYDRWDLSYLGRGSRSKRAVLRVIRLCNWTKYAADVLVPDCAYAAVK